MDSLLANTFLCDIEENIQRENNLPSFYKRYVDATLAVMDSISSAEDFLHTLNEIHPSMSFTMELASNNRLPFLGIKIIKEQCQLKTRVRRKATNTGLLLPHYQSHVDSRHKHSLLNTMLHRAFCLSSTWEFFSDECSRIKGIF